MSSALNTLKKILTAIGGVLLLIAVLPIVIIGLSYWGSLALLRHIFKKLRHDPEVKFESLVSIPVVDSDIDDEVILKNAQEYSEKLTATIANQGNAVAGVVRTNVDRKFIDDQRTITSTRTVKSTTAKIDFKLILKQHQDSHGVVTTEEPEGGDDFALAGKIRASVVLTDKSVTKSLELIIGYDHEAAIFCIAILNGDVRLNERTGQVWVYIKAQDIWMVKVSASPDRWFGYRSEYGQKKARIYWLDTK